MKILHLVDSGGLYGAEKVILSLMKEQVRQGLDPVLLSAGAPGIGEKPVEREARAQGLLVKPWRMRPGLNMGETRKIIAWAHREQFSLLHSHGYKFNILLGMYPRFRRKIPLVTTLHGYVHAKPFQKLWFYERLDRLAVHRMDAIIVVADDLKEHYGSHTESIAKTTVIYNGIDIERLCERAVEPIDAEFQQFFDKHDPAILAVGRLSYEKGFDVLIEAFSRIKVERPGAGLMILGDGMLRRKLEDQIQKLGLGESVRMPGYSHNVPGCLQKADLLAIPSRTEGLPIILLEAMAIEVPLVTTEVGAISKTLGFGRGGIVLRDLTTVGLAAAIGQALDQVKMRDERVSWAKQELVARYSSSTMADHYSRVYERAVT